MFLRGFLAEILEVAPEPIIPRCTTHPVPVQEFTENVAYCDYL